MSAMALHDDRPLARWVVSGMVVLAAHALIVIRLVTLTDLVPAGAPEGIMLVDLEPLSGSPAQGEAGTARPQDQDLTKPVEQTEQRNTLESDRQDEIRTQDTAQPQPITPPVAPPPPLDNATVTTPPPQPHASKPVEKRAPIAGVRAAPAVTRSQPAGSHSDVTLAYARAVMAHINRYKNYPQASRVRGESGTVTLNFKLSRQGRVLASHIVRGSGYATLDHDALDTLRRAQPFPAAPPAVADRDLVFTAPLGYHLN